MTWNFRDSARAGHIVASSLCFFLLVACVAAPAIDAPEPALVAAPPAVSLAIKGPYHAERIEIRSAQAREILKEDPWVKRIVHPDDHESLRAPVLISAEVSRPFGDLSRTSSPVIVLNGKPLSNSIVVIDGADRVYAVAPDSGRLGQILRVQVGWLGALRDTIGHAVEVKLTAIRQ